MHTFTTIVPALPHRIWLDHPVDLRTAFTDEEIAAAERDIQNISTFDDVMRHVGSHGTLLTCTEHRDDPEVLKVVTLLTRC
ncbi:hypothetical protein EAH89_30760, partial [Roseomonas nepalensis]